MSFEDVDVKGERGEERARQAAGFRLHYKIVNVLEMESAEDDQKKDQQRGDARETHEVKAAQAGVRERTPAAQRGGSDQKAGDGEKYLHTALAVPYQGGYELLRKTLSVGNVSEKQTHVHVVHEHKKDGEAAEEIYAVEAAGDRR